MKATEYEKMVVRIIAFKYVISAVFMKKNLGNDSPNINGYRSTEEHHWVSLVQQQGQKQL